jgi:hypothetical protein
MCISLQTNGEEVRKTKPGLCCHLSKYPSLGSSGMLAPNKEVSVIHSDNSLEFSCISYLFRVIANLTASPNCWPSDER